MKLIPILLIVLYAVAMWLLSAWRLRQQLTANSTPLNDPRLSAALDRLGRAMGIGPVKAHVFEIKPVNGLAAPDGRVSTLWQGVGFEWAQVFTTDRYPARDLAVAIEPMTAPANALVSGDGLRFAAPGEPFSASFRLTVTEG